MSDNKTHGIVRIVRHGERRDLHLADREGLAGLEDVPGQRAGFLHAFCCFDGAGVSIKRYAIFTMQYTEGTGVIGVLVGEAERVDGAWIYVDLCQSKLDLFT